MVTNDKTDTAIASSSFDAFKNLVVDVPVAALKPEFERHLVAIQHWLKKPMVDVIVAPAAITAIDVKCQHKIRYHHCC